MASFLDNLSKPVLECQTVIDFVVARDDGAVVVTIGTLIV